ncbi:MAG: hypothetical protein WD009_04210 [Phycisphaeraceae bacterium]
MINTAALHRQLNDGGLLGAARCALDDERLTLESSPETAQRRRGGDTHQPQKRFGIGAAQLR